MTLDGRTRVDTHVKILDDRVVRRAKRRGIEALVYAPHFTRLPEIRRKAQAYSDDELTVVPGREVFTGSWHDRKHVLAIGLDDPVPDFITLDGAMREFERQDAAVIVPHPEYFTVGLAEADIREYRDVVDAVEIYNPKHFYSDTRRAKEIAASVGLPRTGSSYAHLHPTVGSAWTGMDADIEEPADLVAALKESDDPDEWRPRQVAHYTGPQHALERITEIGHLIWENTYKRLDRGFLQGIEATHPRHVAYDGRFDLVAVY